jgi:hypothetical protein
MTNNNQKVTIVEVRHLITDFKKKAGNAAGGNLHIILEDQNTSDSDITFCINEAKDKNDVDAVKIAELMLKMSKTQRLKASYFN